MLPQKRASCAVCWTGGKDSCLAMCRCMDMGYHIDRLATFAPEKPNFLAHPLDVMKLQAQALGLPHQVITVANPYEQSYRQAMIQLMAEGVEALITGDIDLVSGLPNWVVKCAKGLKLEILMPLWQMRRQDLMDELIGGKYRVIFSCVKKPWFTKDWLGRTIDAQAVAELKDIAATTALDICGENGEYHTLVLDSPDFDKVIELTHRPEESGDLFYLDVKTACLT